MTTEEAPSVVAVTGSCSTRDNVNSRFNPGYGRWFTCPLVAYQTSIIALMSPPLDISWKPLAEMNDNDMRNLQSDLDRTFLDQVAELGPELLVLDFFADVHFGVVRVPDGRYATDNRWKLRRTDWYQQQWEAGALTRLTLQNDTDEYLELWREAIHRFAAKIAGDCPTTTVVVHRGWNTNHVRVPGRPEAMRLRRHKSLKPFDVERGNALWAVLDDYCLAELGWESIDLRAEEFVSDADYPWGAFYVHYEPEYDHRFLAEPNKIRLRHSDGEAATYDRVLQIEAAARESGQRRWRQAQALADARVENLLRQSRRIEELESLGVVRGVKFAVGQRLRARTGRKSS